MNKHNGSLVDAQAGSGRADAVLSRKSGFVLFLERVFGNTADLSRGRSGRVKDQVDEFEKILPMARAIAISKSLLTLLLGLAFFVAGFLYFERSMSILFSPRYLTDVVDFLTRGEAVLPTGAISGDYIYPLQDTLPGMMVIGLVGLGLLALVLAPGFLFLIGYRLVTREVLEKELDEAGTLIQRIRSGLGRVKPMEEMLHSIFGRSHSAWDLRLWSARITFVVGIILLAVALWALLVMNNAVFFGGGAAAGLISTAISRWLNPAEKIQEVLAQNAAMEISVISFVQQMALVEGWMNKASLSIKSDGTWEPEQKIYQSLERNTAIIRRALEDTSRQIAKAAKTTTAKKKKKTASY